MTAHTFNLCTSEAETGGSLDLEASLVYRESSRASRATQWYPVSEKNKQQQQQQSVNTSREFVSTFAVWNEHVTMVLKRSKWTGFKASGSEWLTQVAAGSLCSSLPTQTTDLLQQAATSSSQTVILRCLLSFLELSHSFAACPSGMSGVSSHA